MLSRFVTVEVVATTVGSGTAEDLANHWLNTGGIPVLKPDGSKAYPRRSDLRRAEARRRSHSRPAGTRRSEPVAGHQRPQSPIAAPYSRPMSRRPLPHPQYPLAPTPAVLPIPQTTAARPAGIDVPVPRSTSAFRPPLQPSPVPLAGSAEWGLDLTSEPPAAPEAGAARRRVGRLNGTATRLLVMALVVGTEGVAVSHYLAPSEADSSSSAADFSVDEVPLIDGPETDVVVERDAAVERDAVVERSLEQVKEGAPAKAEAALEQARKGSADLSRQREAARKKAAERAARAKREAARASRPAVTTSAVPRPSVSKPSGKPSVTRPEVSQPVASKPAVVKKPAAKKPVVKKPVVEKPAAKKPAAKKPAVKKPAAKKPVAEKKLSSRKKALKNARKNPKAAARVLVADRGWSSTQFTCLDSLWERESNWNYRADNPSSSAYGIPQALPGSKMKSAGSDWKTNPATQIEWGLGYIEGRYGSPCKAWSHSQSTGWY